MMTGRDVRLTSLRIGLVRGHAPVSDESNGATTRAGQVRAEAGPGVNICPTQCIPMIGTVSGKVSLDCQLAVSYDQLDCLR